MTIQAIVFDAYGTLFDVASVEHAVADVTPNAANFTALWRAKQLEYAFLRTLMDRYADFWQVTSDALRFTAERLDVDIESSYENLMNAWLNVAPFPDAADALHLLAHFRRAILSNGTPQMLHAALHAAHLRTNFEAVLSVDAVRKYEPHPDVYALVATELGVSADNVAFVSSNGWDVAGATAFGFRTYWINRAHLPPEQLGVRPTAVLHSLAELVPALQPL